MTSRLLLVPASCLFLAWLTIQCRKLRRRVPPKRRFNFNELHCVISQKTELFKTTSVGTLTAIYNVIEDLLPVPLKDISYCILELLHQSLGHFLHSTPLKITVKFRRRNLELLFVFKKVTRLAVLFLLTEAFKYFDQCICLRCAFCWPMLLMFTSFCVHVFVCLFAFFAFLFQS
jgi:hypothetical protein